ncbi:hypothetical protein OH77DRAFT_833121 [Trametes cingulata]|nr:hypothetical protein OH77DRAFT_833121 [Trametes cingulata]
MNCASMRTRYCSTASCFAGYSSFKFPLVSQTASPPPGSNGSLPNVAELKSATPNPHAPVLIAYYCIFYYITVMRSQIIVKAVP